MIHADLHVHTNASDGSLALSAVPDAARTASVRVVAITDHDRPHPDLDDPVVVRDGITLVHGIELRVAPAGTEPVDLLGYGLRRTPALDAEVTRLQRDRVGRARVIVDRVEDRLGIDLAIDVEPGVGRPHIARAIAAHPDSDHGYRDAFDQLIGSDRPCYVARDLPSFERGTSILREACALVGLAHPLRHPNPGAAIVLAEDLDAIERWYPYDGPVDPEPVKRAISGYDLVATGGSDAHDGTLGRAGLSRSAYERVRETLSQTEG